MGAGVRPFCAERGEGAGGRAGQRRSGRATGWWGGGLESCVAGECPGWAVLGLVAVVARGGVRLTSTETNRVLLGARLRGRGRVERAGVRVCGWYGPQITLFRGHWRLVTGVGLAVTRDVSAYVIRQRVGCNGIGVAQREIRLAQRSR